MVSSLVEWIACCSPRENGGCAFDIANAVPRIYYVFEAVPRSALRLPVTGSPSGEGEFGRCESSFVRHYVGHARRWYVQGRGAQLIGLRRADIATRFTIQSRSGMNNAGVMAG